MGVKVLFLGAGASMAAGYPSGSQLLEAVEAYFATEMTDVGSKEAWNRFVAWRLASTEDQSLRLIVGSKNPEVLISYMDLVEQASRSEHSRLTVALPPLALQGRFAEAVSIINRLGERVRSTGYATELLATTTSVQLLSAD